jgi:CDP-paratose 2-epimerase
MKLQRCLITGGAGFVGSRLALLLAADGVEVIVMDNLKRRGSELNLPELKSAGVVFFHGDVRNPADFSVLPSVDLLIDASAEPSVHAGSSGTPDYVVHTNLLGTYHMLEWARQNDAAFLLLSTSRVYPIAHLEKCAYQEKSSRFTWCGPFSSGVSEKGISESFPLDGPRSLYGTSKLCSEHLLEEYVHMFGMKGVINRCGILAGAHQMGKVDQGVVALWCARHLFGGSLAYHGYGGLGKQVRDMLHVSDLYRLIQSQWHGVNHWKAEVYNVGGGVDFSVSLKELTQLCCETTGKAVTMGSKPETSPLDLRCYITDSTKAMTEFNWEPKVSPRAIVEEIVNWLKGQPEKLKPLFA